MKNKEKKNYKISKGWVAFINEGVLIDIREFPNGGAADTSLELINKATKEEVEAELASKNITLKK